VESVARPPIRGVVSQHVEDAATLRSQRTHLVSAPHVGLLHLGRLDERLAAHLDGIAMAGEFGSKLCEDALANPGVGEVFVATVRAIEEKNVDRFDRLFALAEGIPQAADGLNCAFGWVSGQHLTGMGAGLLSSANAFREGVGIAACAMHGVDPGPPLDGALRSADVALRARALRAVGELGKVASLPAVRQALEDKNEGCRFWAAWSMVLLGDRGSALGALSEFCRKPGPFRERALRLALCAMELKSAHELLQLIARDPKDIRALIQGAGIGGDPSYVPWLIKQMTELKLTRLAGESFSLITGLDLAYLDLEVKPPENFEGGPTDDPEDPNVDMDPDDGLPWPDAAKIEDWWKANGSRFAAGTRYFMGAPVTHEHCLQVLRDGFQRQRRLAAQYLCLLNPGTPLFNIAAPAWRQQRRLSKLS
jgi:uncharacterized protein (TIGR02270 family)